MTDVPEFQRGLEPVQENYGHLGVGSADTGACALGEGVSRDCISRLNVGWGLPECVRRQAAVGGALSLGPKLRAAGRGCAPDERPVVGLEAGKKAPRRGGVLGCNFMMQSYWGTTLLACKPFGPCSISNVTAWPSAKVLKPEPCMALK